MGNGVDAPSLPDAPRGQTLQLQATILDQIDDAVIAVDARQCITYLNRAAEERYGVHAAEAVGRPASELYTWRWLHPEDEAQSRACLAQAGRWRGENLHITHDGREISVESTVVALHSESGEQIGLLAVIRDISRRKAREHKLDEQLRLLDLSRDAIWVRDAHDRVTYWNSGAVAMYGYTPEEAMGKVTHDLLKTEFAEPLPAIQEKLQQQGRWEGELVHTRRDGSRITVSSRWVADRDGEGRIAAVLVTNSDITERKRAEEALRASEQRHRELAEALEAESGKLAAVIENLPVGVAIADTQGTILSMNRAGLLLHGFASPEQVPLRPEEYFRQYELRQLDGRILPLELWPISRAARGDYVHGYEVSLLNRQGGEAQGAREAREAREARTVSYTVVPVRNRHAEAILLVYVMQDLTEQKRAERALRESEERFRAMADAIPQLAWIATADGWVYWYNRRWYEYTGTTRRQMEVWGWQGFHDPKVLPEVEERWNESVRTGTPFEMVFPLRGVDGMFRPFLTRMMPLRDRLGHVVQWFGTSTDIAELRRQQEEIQHLNRTLKALSDSSQALGRAREEMDYLAEVCRIIVEDCGHAMVWVGYAEDDEARSVRPVAWSGLEEGYLQALQITWADTEHGRGPTGTAIRTGQVSVCRNILTDPRLEPWRAEALRRGYASSIALPLLREGKAFGSLTIYAREPDPFSEDEVKLLEELAGDLAHGLEAIRLRNARDQAEAELRQAKEAAESANRAKDYFLAMLSHELRNPLNPALMAATILEKHPQLPPELHGDVDVIRRNVELETRLIDDLLDLTRITRGKLTLRRRMADACELLRYAAQTCQAEIAAKQLALELALPEEAIPTYTDPARLQQVFWNLIKNAVKFTPEGGRITVRAGKTEQGGLRVEVIDTGKGIEKEALERIFDAFEQGEPGITKRYGGLGLGLAICKGLVGMHEGQICALSDGPGTGATFIVELPPPPKGVEQPAGEGARGNAREDARAAERNEGVGVGAGAGEPACRILLVEDDESTARLTARLLASFGHQVTIASGVGDALVKFEQEPFDILISDLGLPDGTGKDLLRQLLAKRPLKAIALSGYGMESDIQESVAAGFMAHLVKPIHAGQLKDIIGQARAAR